jgi:hypothetical protein
MTALFVISTKWDTFLEWITNWHYPELRGYFTLKSFNDYLRINKKFSDFCKMKFVHVHFAVDWMNKFPNRGRYQIANFTSWQNSLYCSQLSTFHSSSLYVHGYILMTIGSVFFFGTRTFVYKLKNNRKS